MLVICMSPGKVASFMSRPAIQLDAENDIDLWSQPLGTWKLCSPNLASSNLSTTLHAAHYAVTPEQPPHVMHIKSIQHCVHCLILSTDSETFAKLRNCLQLINVTCMYMHMCTHATYAMVLGTWKLCSPNLASSNLSTTLHAAHYAVTPEQPPHVMHIKSIQHCVHCLILSTDSETFAKLRNCLQLLNVTCMYMHMCTHATHAMVEADLLLEVRPGMSPLYNIN